MATSASNHGTLTEGRKCPTAVDLYSGSGAITAALKQAGYRVAAAIDNDPVACETYRLNHQDTRIYPSNIHDVNPYTILEQDLDNQPLNLLVACAPCQPFSSQNKKRGNPHDFRTDLILEAARFAAVLRPRQIFFENVAGLTTPGFRPLLEELETRLGKLGYTLGKPRRVDAAHLGVPQRRIRCIMLAALQKSDTQIDLQAIKRPQRTVRQVIGHLPSLAPGEVCPSDKLHKARNHSAIAIKRLKQIPRDGGSRFSLPTELELACHKNFNGHPDVYGRMQWDDVAPTLTTGCTDITRGRFAHPQDDRAITLREAALLQTFPQDYRFSGNSGDIARQIGNAVPVQMAEALFAEICGSDAQTSCA